MRIVIFSTYATVFLASLIVALRAAGGRLAEPGAEPGQRRTPLHVAALVVLAPLLLKGLFSAFPRLEADVMPVCGYALIQRDFFWPFAALFFAIASRLVPHPSRRAVVLLTTLIVLSGTVLGVWRLLPSDDASWEGFRDRDGVCRQSTSYTCAAASMVTLLDRKGIASTEGEMAVLSATLPRRGATFFQVARALRLKLAHEGRADPVRISTPEPEDLERLPTPFLTGTRLSLLIDHMICVLSVEGDSVRVADPLNGLVTLDRQAFEDEWLGIVVTVGR